MKHALDRAVHDERHGRQRTDSTLQAVEGKTCAGGAEGDRPWIGRRAHDDLERLGTQGLQSQNRRLDKIGAAGRFGQHHALHARGDAVDGEVTGEGFDPTPFGNGGSGRHDCSQWSAIAALSASGASRLSRCPAPGITTSLAPGMRSAMACA